LNVHRIIRPIHGYGGAIGEGAAFAMAVGVEKLVIRHFEQAHATVERSHFADERERPGVDAAEVHRQFRHPGAEAAQEEIAAAAAHAFAVRDEHGVVIHELVQRHGDGPAQAAALVDGIGEGDDPIRSGFRDGKAEVTARPVHEVGLAEHGVRTRRGMFRIVILIRRHVTDDVDVNAVRVNAVREEELIVLLQFAELETRVQITLRPAVPMAHVGDLPLLPIAKARTGKGDGREIGRLFVNGEVGIEGGRVGVVIAVLVVKHEGPAERMRGVIETLHAGPTAGHVRRR